jgi:hypothetical protein
LHELLVGQARRALQLKKGRFWQSDKIIYRFDLGHFSQQGQETRATHEYRASFT